MSIKGVLEGRKTRIRLFVLVGSGIGLSLCTGLIIGFMVMLLTIGSPARMEPILQSILYLKMIQLLSTFLMFLVPALLLAYLSSSNTAGYLHADKGISSRVVVGTIIMILVMQPFINLTSVWFDKWYLPSNLSWLEHWLKSIEVQNNALVMRFLNVTSPGALLFNIVLVAIVPAIGEEFFFRGGLQRLFAEKMNIHAAIWITAIIFSAVHVEVAGFLPRVALGAGFGYLLVWSGSIWVPVLAHFTNNLFGVMGEYLIYNQYVDKQMDKFGTGTTEWMSWLGLCLSICLLWLLYKRLKPNSLS